MDDFLIGLASFLLLNMLAGMLRVWAGPTPADRMLAAQLFGSTGVALVVVLAHPLRMAAFYDVALILALLAALATIVFVRQVWVTGPADGAAQPEITREDSA